MKKRWIPILVASVILLSAVAVLLGPLGKRNDTPSLYEPLEIKSAPNIYHTYVKSIHTVSADDCTMAILQFDSYKEVIDFEKQYNKENPTKSPYNAMSREYDKEFFETKTLVVLYGENDYSYAVKPGEVYCDGKKIVIEICYEEKGPHFDYESVMEEWGYAFVMDKRAMEKVTTLDAYRTVIQYDIS